MTLRTSESDDKAVTELAARWGVSKQQAVLRAVREVIEREDRKVDVLALSDRYAAEDAVIMERLKNA